MVRFCTSSVPRLLDMHKHAPVYDHHHAVQFYGDDASLFPTVAGFLSQGFVDGHPAIVIATERHRSAILDHLRGRLIDVEKAQQMGSLILLDARQILDLFMAACPMSIDSRRASAGRSQTCSHGTKMACSCARTARWWMYCGKRGIGRRDPPRDLLEQIGTASRLRAPVRLFHGELLQGDRGFRGSLPRAHAHHRSCCRNVRICPPPPRQLIGL